MSFALTTYDGKPVAISNTDQIVLGTCMLGDDYGEVKSASLVRTGQEEEILGCDKQIVAWLITNPGFELKMEARFDAGVEPPEILDAIVFPFAGVTGHVAPGAEIKWSEGGVRMLSFTAKNWDALNDGGTRYRWDTATSELVALGASSSGA